MRIWSDRAAWWTLLNAPEDYAEEAQLFRDAVGAQARRPIERLLGLGGGSGDTAGHLSSSLRLGLGDVSTDMLAVSRALNPDCEYVQGDMRSLRQG